MGHSPYHLRARDHITDALYADTVQNGCSDIQSSAWRLTTLYLSSLVHVADVSGRGRPALRSAGSNRLRNSTVQAVNHRRSCVSGRSSTVLEQAARQFHVSQFVVGFPAATEAHTVPAVIPRHYHVTFHFLTVTPIWSYSSGIAILRPL